MAGEFGWDVTIKTNAVGILRREFERWQAQPFLNSGFLMLGGGGGDSFQPAEKTYRLTHQVLQLIHEYGFPVHILTKATLIERDLALIKKIHDRKRGLVSMSFSSVDAEASQIFEPHVPPPEQRLATLQKFKNAGLPMGIFLIPLIPFITDNQEQIDYYCKLQGRRSPYGYAAHSLSKLNQSLAEMKGRFRELQGIGPTTERLINEILETGKSTYLERLQSRSR